MRRTLTRTQLNNDFSIRPQKGSGRIRPEPFCYRPLRFHVLVQNLLQLVLRVVPHDGVDHFTVFLDQERWNTHDTEVLRRVRVGINVHLVERHLITHFFRQLFNNW